VLISANPPARKGTRRRQSPHISLPDPPAPSDQCAHHHKQTGNLRAVQILLGHSNIESTVRYLGVDVEHALTLAEGTEV